MQKAAIYVRDPLPAPGSITILTGKNQPEPRTVAVISATARALTEIRPVDPTGTTPVFGLTGEALPTGSEPLHAPPASGMDSPAGSAWRGGWSPQERPTLRYRTKAGGNTGIWSHGYTRGESAGEARWSDLQREENGSARLRIPFSKLDHTGTSDLVYVSPKTVAALHEMRNKNQDQGIDSTDDLIFRMTTPQLRQFIRKACEAAGLLGRYGAASPRIGMAMDLAMSHVSLDDLARLGRWKNPAMPRHLIRSTYPATFGHTGFH